MKGEITCSKRHLKGHKSKLSFSRFDDPRVTSRLFPHSIVLPRNAWWANHQVINCSPASPAANLEENREISGLGTDFFGHQSTLPKKAPNDFLGFVTKSGEEEASLGEKTSQREFSRKEGAAAALSSCAGNGKQAFVSSLSLPLDVTWTSRPGILRWSSRRSRGIKRRSWNDMERSVRKQRDGFHKEESSREGKFVAPCRC